MFSYLYNGKQHTTTTAAYCEKLGMDAEAIEQLQQDDVLHAEHRWNEVRAERALRMSDIEWRLHRMYREDMLGLARTDSEDAIIEVHQYMQALADTPNNAATPDEVVWPVLDV